MIPAAETNRAVSAREPGSSRRRRPLFARPLLALLAVVSVAACTSGGSDAGGDEAVTTTTTPSGPDLGAPDSVDTLQGQLAVVDGHRLTVMNPDGSEPIVMAGDDDGVVGLQPAWSPDGSQLAWAQTDGATASVEVALPRAQAVSSTSFDTVPFYLGWNDAGNRLAYLRNAPSGPGFEAGVVDGDSASVAATGAPLYLAWRPGADDLAIHRNEASVDVVDATTAVVDPGLPGDAAGFATTGQFATPIWVRDDVLGLVQDGAFVLVDVETGDKSVLLEIGEGTRLVLSPDRSKLAYLTVVTGTQTVGLPRQVDPPETLPPETLPPRPCLPSLPPETLPPETLPGGDGEPGIRLRVFDFVTGRDDLVTDEPVLAFEWSPDGAFLSWLGQAGPGLAQWHIWTRAGELTNLAPYRPSALDAGAYLPFFDQYVQSQHRWDPDGTAMAFAGTIGGESGIWVQLVEGDFGPFLVAPGDYVTWSPPPGGGGGASVL